MTTTNKKGFDLKTGFIKGKPAYIIVITILFLLLIFSVLIAATLGAVDLSMKEVYQVILNKSFGIGEDGAIKATTYDIVWHIRFPRIILATGVGMALAVSGCIIQAIVKNPLADPYIIGISSGAYLGAVLAIMLGVGKIFGTNAIGIFAFIGAFGISLLVQVIANLGRRANSIRLLLGGLALGAACSAISNFIVYIKNDREGIQTVTYWLMGSLAGADWENIIIILPVVFVLTMFFVTQSRILNLMLLGDDVAITLGVDLVKYRHVYLVLSALMVGMAVYCAGMIGFIGLIIPHIVRMFFGTDHKRLVPVSALLGSIFLIWADVACRIILKGSEIPVGILVSTIGAPCFIYLLISRSYGFGDSE
jgi:iron complex transport system permease protein